MPLFRKICFTLVCLGCLKAASATKHSIKTVGYDFEDDSVYALIGDTIKFIIGTGHDASEITMNSYITNLFDPVIDGFVFTSGIHEFVITETKTFYYASTMHLTAMQMKGVIISSDPFASNSDIIYQDNIIFYPNPVENNLQVIMPDDVNFTFSIIDAQGKIVYTEALYSNKLLDLSYLKQGVYFLAIQSEEKRFTKVFIKN